MSQFPINLPVLTRTIPLLDLLSAERFIFKELRLNQARSQVPPFLWGKVATRIAWAGVEVRVSSATLLLLFTLPLLVPARPAARFCRGHFPLQ